MRSERASSLIYTSLRMLNLQKAVVLKLNASNTEFNSKAPSEENGSSAHMFDMKNADYAHSNQCNKQLLDKIQQHSVFQLFSEVAANSLHSVAIRDGSSQITYGELLNFTRIVSANLKCVNVGNEPVAIILPRSLLAISSILSVVRSGAPYVFIDPAYPNSRVEKIIETSKCSVIIVDNVTQTKIPKCYEGVTADVVTLRAEASSEIVDGNCHPLDTLYYIFTSGSTGMPKGVEVVHQNIANMALSYISRFSVDGGDSFAQFASLSFAASVIEIYVSLLSGATLNIVPEEVKLNQVKFAKYLADQKITLALLPPNYAALLSADSTPLRILITAGSSTNWKVVDQWREHATYVNVYGCSETGTGVSAYIASESACGSIEVPIGEANFNTHFYVVDKNNQLVGGEGVGELCVAGPCIAKGYLNNPKLTTEKFSICPFDAEHRMYKTGDIAFRNAAGHIEIMGRIDDQINLQGHRIEPGEINALILKIQGVRDSVVVGQNIRDTTHICAYCIVDSKQVLDGIRAYLAERLPDYMLPNFIVEMDSIPVNINGKVDKKSLPLPGSNQTNSSPFCAPESDLEKMIAQSWEYVLHLEDDLSVHDNYFLLGGDSIGAIRIVANLYEKSIFIRVQDILNNPTVSGLSMVAVFKGLEESTLEIDVTEAASKQTQRQLQKQIVQRLDRLGLDLHCPPLCKKMYPLSPMQQALYLSFVADRDSKYIVHQEYRLSGNVNVSKLKNCLEAIVARHDVLRTVFAQLNSDEPRQYVLNALPLKFNQIEMQFLNADERSQEIKNWVQVDRAKNFELECENALRFTLIQWSENEYSLVLCYHHIIMDGWCQTVFWKDLIHLYYFDDANQEAELEPVPEYDRYINWLHNLDDALALDYWQQCLNGYELPTRTDSSSHFSDEKQYKEIIFKTSQAQTQRLELLCKQYGLTPSTALKALWGLAQHSYKSVDDIVFGEVVAGRPPHLSGSEHIMGLFVNTIPVRVRAKGADNLLELMRDVQKISNDSYEHQYVALSKIQANTTAKNRLLDHIFVFENYPDLDEGRTENNRDFDVQVGYDLDEVNYDLNVSVSMENIVRTRVLFRSPEYTEASIGRLYAKFEKLIGGLDSLIHEPLAMVHQFLNEDVDVSIIRGERKQHTYATVYQAFTAQVKRTPDATALVAMQRSDAQPDSYTSVSEVTYLQLQNQVDLVAYNLRRELGETGHCVAILLERSVEYVVTMLACMKSGITYVPLDEIYDVKRMNQILEAAKPDTIISTSVLIEEKQVTKHEWLEANRLFTDYELYSPHKQNSNTERVADNEVVHVLFTSGTTGTPKGVNITQRGLLNHAEFIKDKLSLSVSKTVLQFACLGFDTSNEEIFPALISGAKVVLRDKGMLDSFEWLVKAVSTFSISVLDLPTSYWNHWVENLIDSDQSIGVLSSLSHIVLGGEKISEQHVRRWFDFLPNVPVINSYGPTETTIISTWNELHASSEGEISLGQPIYNTDLFILGSDKNPVVLGDVGELHIYGAGVAAGYINVEDQSQSAFMDANCLELPGRLYRTGDLVKVDPVDGRLCYLGRADNQVKIRGYRIDLLDVQKMIEAIGGVKQSVVTAIQGKHNQSLVAFIQPEGIEGMKGENIQRAIQLSLPSQLMPSHMSFVKSWPLNANGKLDINRLIAELSASATNVEAVDMTPTEVTIQSIWQTVLDQPITDLDSSFFDIGGHSLQAISMLSKIKRETGKKITVDVLFKLPTIRQIAQYIDGAGGADTNRVMGNIISLGDHHSEEKHNLFLFAPVGGSAMCYHQIATSLSQRFNVYGVQLINILDYVPDQTPLSQRVTKLFKQLQNMPSASGTCLAGWSMGGVIAQQMACEYQRRGKTIDALVLMDSWHPGFLPASEVESRVTIEGFAIDFARAINPNASLPNFSQFTLDQCWGVFREKKIIPLDLSEQSFTKIYQSYVENQSIYIHHVPEKYYGDAVLFQSLKPKAEITLIPEMLGWSDSIETILVEKTEADHYQQLTGETGQRVIDSLINRVKQDLLNE